LLLLRPRRERVEEPQKSDRLFTIVSKISFSMGGTRSKQISDATFPPL
jgi:hypothetical protein